MDCFILSLYHLQIFYCNEIRRGIAGLGEYTIASEHKNIEVQGLENVAYLKALSPDDIVKNIRTGICIDPSSICIDPSSIDDTYAGETKEEKTNTSTRSNNMSSLTRAREVMKADDISFNTKFHCFNVKGTSGTTRVVTLFPKKPAAALLLVIVITCLLFG